MIQRPRTNCPKCGDRNYKDALDLTYDERMAAEAVTMLRKYGDPRRHKHYVCMNCFHIEYENETIV